MIDGGAALREAVAALGAAPIRFGPAPVLALAGRPAARRVDAFAGADAAASAERRPACGGRLRALDRRAAARARREAAER